MGSCEEQRPGQHICRRKPAPPTSKTCASPRKPISPPTTTSCARQDALKQVLDSTVSAYQEALELTRNLYQAGLSNDEAVAQAESQLQADSGAGHQPGRSARSVRTRHRGAGRSARLYFLRCLRPRQIGLRHPSIPIGVPSQLLERRPDIAEAERAVAQANAQIGFAKTAFFPALTLSAQAGFQSLSIANWFAWPSRVWSVGPASPKRFSTPDCAAPLSSSIRRAYDQTVANYRQTVLTAFQQVEDNLAALRILSPSDRAAGFRHRVGRPKPARSRGALPGRTRSVPERDRRPIGAAEQPAVRGEFSSATNGGQRPVDQGAGRRMGRNCISGQTLTLTTTFWQPVLLE